MYTSEEDQQNSAQSSRKFHHNSSKSYAAVAPSIETLHEVNPATVVPNPSNSGTGALQSFLSAPASSLYEEKAHLINPLGNEVTPAVLQSKLVRTFALIKQHPIEFYESLLYDITRFFSVQLFGQLPNLVSIEKYHPLKKLQDAQEDMSSEDQCAIVYAIENLIESYTFAQLDYRLFMMVINLITGLLIKWELSNDFEYSYRYRDAIFSSKIIDMQDLHNGVVSMEVVYFACVVNKPPLQSVIHPTVKQYAEFFLEAFMDLVNSLLRLTEADFLKVPSISGFLAARDPKLAEVYGMVPDFTTYKPEYHSLGLKHGCKALCISSKTDKVNLALKEILTDFELAYRHFEAVLVKDLAHLKAADRYP